MFRSLELHRFKAIQTQFFETFHIDEPIEQTDLRVPEQHQNFLCKFIMTFAVPGPMSIFHLTSTHLKSLLRVVT